MTINGTMDPSLRAALLELLVEMDNDTAQNVVPMSCSSMTQIKEPPENTADIMSLPCLEFLNITNVRLLTVSNAADVAAGDSSKTVIYGIRHDDTTFPENLMFSDCEYTNCIFKGTVEAYGTKFKNCTFRKVTQFKNCCFEDCTFFNMNKFYECKIIDSRCTNGYIYSTVFTGNAIELYAYNSTIDAKDINQLHAWDSTVKGIIDISDLFRCDVDIKCKAAYLHGCTGEIPEYVDVSLFSKRSLTFIPFNLRYFGSPGHQIKEFNYWYHRWTTDQFPPLVNKKFARTINAVVKNTNLINSLQMIVLEYALSPRDIRNFEDHDSDNEVD